MDNVRWMKVRNAIEDAVMEMKKCPYDSIQDICNEMFNKWDTGLEMDCNLKIQEKQ